MGFKTHEDDDDHVLWCELRLASTCEPLPCLTAFCPKYTSRRTHVHMCTLNMPCSPNAIDICDAKHIRYFFSSSAGD